MIFPLKNSIAISNRPYMVWTILFLTTAIFLFQQTLPQREFIRFTFSYGFIPAAFDAPHYSFLGLPGIVSYIFIHSGWWHLLSNMWLLWLFGDAIEDITGPWRFAFFYLSCGIAAAIVHYITSPASTIPIVGASGAISGVLGAFFLLYPNARITTFIFFLIIQLPAFFYLGIWVALQMLYGITENDVSVAWWAHVGGFFTGILLIPFFRCKRPLSPLQPKGYAPPPRYDPENPWARFRSK